MNPGYGIDILLATYNGERYLPELLASLMAQSDQGFRILARDDGSRDGTVGILKDFRAAAPGRLDLVETLAPGLGACGNFAELARLSSAPYVMFSDQDDVWHADKVAVSLAEMRRLEGEAGASTPILVHADLRVVDAGMHEIAASFAAFQRQQHHDGSVFAFSLIQNVVAGCTILANRALVELALPIPPAAILHDHWLALVAAAFGRISHIDHALVDYRQHDANAVGASGMGWLGMRQRARSIVGGGLRQRLQAHSGQAAAFLGRFDQRLAGADRRACASLASMPRLGWWGRRSAIIRNRLWMTSLLRNLAWLAMV